MDLRLPLLPRWFRWAAVAAVAGFVFYASIVTAPPETPIDVVRPSLLDKWRHFLAYAALAATLAYATVDWERPMWHVAAFVVGVTVVYGVGIEAWQSFIPNRYFSVWDAVANAIGGLLTLPWFAVQRRARFLPVGEWAGSFGTPDSE